MTFIFPAIHSFPPFYTLQPNTTTREAQLRHWSKLIQSYCRHYRLFKLSISDQLDSELFSHRTLRKSLNAADVRRVLEFMRDEEHAAQPMTTAGGGGGSGSSTAGNNGVWWIWWRKPEEWANLLEVWIDEVGQKNTVLTLYELTQGDLTRGTEIHGVDPQVLQRALTILVKKGKAQVFGSDDQQGVKFF